MTKTEARIAEPNSWGRRIYGALLTLIGAGLGVGGAFLVTLGGSPYYLAAGAAAAVSGVLLWSGRRSGAWVYGALLVGTVAWSVWEVGFDPWGLLPRLVAPFVLGFGLLLPSVRKIGGEATSKPRVGGASAFAGGLVIAVLAGAGLNAIGPERSVDPLWQTGAKVAAPQKLERPLAEITNGDWPFYGNDRGGTRFSALDQITPANVSKLEVAWEAETGPMVPGASTGGLQVTPSWSATASMSATATTSSSPSTPRPGKNAGVSR